MARNDSFNLGTLSNAPHFPVCPCLGNKWRGRTNRPFIHQQVPLHWVWERLQDLNQELQSCKLDLSYLIGLQSPLQRRNGCAEPAPTSWQAIRCLWNRRNWKILVAKAFCPCLINKAGSSAYLSASYIYTQSGSERPHRKKKGSGNVPWFPGIHLHLFQSTETVVVFPHLTGRRELQGSSEGIPSCPLGTLIKNLQPPL